MKTIHIALAAAAACAVMTAGAAGAKPMTKAEGDRVIAKLRAQEKRWNTDIKTRDAAKFASYYDEHATVMDPFLAPQHGRAAVEAGMKQVFKDPNFSLTFEADAVRVTDELAYTQGHCVETETDQATHAKVTNPCSYVTVYKHERDGSWKAIEDIASPSAPPKS